MCVTVSCHYCSDVTEGAAWHQTLIVAQTIALQNCLTRFLTTGEEEGQHSITLLRLKQDRTSIAFIDTTSTPIQWCGIVHGVELSGLISYYC